MEQGEGKEWNSALYAKKTLDVSENSRRFKENHKKTKCADMAQFLLKNLNQNSLKTIENK